MIFSLTQLEGITLTLNRQMMKFFQFIVFAVLLNACNRETSSDPNNSSSPNLLWKVSTVDDGHIAESGIIRASVSAKGNILVGGRFKNERALFFLNGNTGEKIWTWNDYLYKNGNRDIYFPSVFNNTFYCQLANSNYAIDIISGKTIWSNKFNNTFGNYVNLVGEKFFTGIGSDKSLNSNLLGFYKNSINDGVPNLIDVPQYDTTNMLQTSGQTGEVDFVLPYYSGTDTLLVVCYSDPPITNFKFRNAIGLYNFSKMNWVYKRIVLDESSSFGFDDNPKILESKVYCIVAGKLSCNTVLTGESSWIKTFDPVSSFLSTGFIIADNKIFANNENLYLYCLDPKTGATIWKQGIFGTCSQMTYLNGVVYFVCGGDGKLYAIDAANGNKLWAISSPDVKISSQASFDRYVGLIPPQNGQKGKIVVTTGLNAYCYEAYK